MNSTQQTALDQPEYALWKRISRSNMESGIIEAIKALRREFGMGLKEAKDVVELYRNKTSAGHEAVSHVRISDKGLSGSHPQAPRHQRYPRAALSGTQPAG